MYQPSMTSQNLRKGISSLIYGSVPVGIGSGQDSLIRDSAVVSVANGSSDLQKSGRSIVAKRLANITGCIRTRTFDEVKEHDMSIFKRGRTYWFHFYFNGEHVQRSTRQGN